MKVTAVYKNARITPKKASLIAGMVRRKSVQDAMDLLKFAQKKAADIILKLLKSAVANAHVKKLDKKSLVISKLTVNKGSVLKRWKPVSRGRAHAFQKKSCHIILELEGEERKSAKGLALESLDPHGEESAVADRKVKKKEDVKKIDVKKTEDKKEVKDVKKVEKKEVKKD